MDGMKPQHIAAVIGFLLLLGSLVFLGAAGRHIVKTYNEAVSDNVTLKQAVIQRDNAIVKWQTRETELLALRKADTEALERKEAELKAARERLAKTTKEFTDAIDKLEGEDRACAVRRVPAAVDRLLR